MTPHFDAENPAIWEKLRRFLIWFEVQDWRNRDSIGRTYYARWNLEDGQERIKYGNTKQDLLDQIVAQVQADKMSLFNGSNACKIYVDEANPPKKKEKTEPVKQNPYRRKL